MKTKSKILYYSINILAPLIIGVIIYVLARPETIISQIVYKIFHINHESIIDIPRFFTNYGCDFLWSYSLVNGFYLVTQSYKYTLVVCISFNILVEIMQLLPIISLVFDPIDIFVESLAILIGLAFILIFENNRVNKHNNHEW